MAVGSGGHPLLEAIERAGHDANRFILRPEGWLSEFKLGIRAAIEDAVRDYIIGVLSDPELRETSARMRDVRAREAREGKPRPAPCRPYGYLYGPDLSAAHMTIAATEPLPREHRPEWRPGSDCGLLCESAIDLILTLDALTGGPLTGVLSW